MKLLLDTHIWLWSVLDPSKLGERVSALLRDSSSHLWLSPISLWELAVLYERGRIEVHGGLWRWIDEARRSAPIREAPLTGEIVRATDRVEIPHRDPADRLLAATAVTLDLRLVTADAKLLAGRGYQVLNNREEHQDPSSSEPDTA